MEVMRMTASCIGAATLRRGARGRKRPAPELPFSARESLAEEPEGRLPMPLGGCLVIDGQIAHREAVPRTGIGLDQMVHACFRQRPLEPVLLLVGEGGILDGAGDIDAAAQLAEEKMRTVGLPRREMPAVKSRRRREAIGEGTGGGQAGIAPHAIAGGAEAITLDLGPG